MGRPSLRHAAMILANFTRRFAVEGQDAVRKILPKGCLRRLRDRRPALPLGEQFDPRQNLRLGDAVR